MVVNKLFTYSYHVPISQKIKVVCFSAFQSNSNSTTFVSLFFFFFDNLDQNINSKEALTKLLSTFSGFWPLKGVGGGID